MATVGSCASSLLSGSFYFNLTVSVVETGDLIKDFRSTGNKEIPLKHKSWQHVKLLINLSSWRNVRGSFATGPEDTRPVVKFPLTLCQLERFIKSLTFHQPLSFSGISLFPVDWKSLIKSLLSTTLTVKLK